MTDLPQGARSRRVDRAGVVIALALAGLAAVLVWDSRQLPATTMYGMGPEVMPVVIAVVPRRPCGARPSKATARDSGP